MASICVRDLPDIVKQTLRVEAACAGISMEALARRLLIEGVVALARRATPAVDGTAAGGYPGHP